MKYKAIYNPEEGILVQDLSELLKVGDLVEVNPIGTFVVVKHPDYPPQSGSLCKRCAFHYTNCIAVRLSKNGDTVCATPRGCIFVPVDELLEEL